ncbi:hypothetical protein [Pseudomonas sp. NFACC46-3]|nr:hypothetical protein [Pseudomonas sp. NFACC46-3]
MTAYEVPFLHDLSARKAAPLGGSKDLADTFDGCKERQSFLGMQTTKRFH